MVLINKNRRDRRARAQESRDRMEQRDMKEQLKSLFNKEKITIKAKRANPAVQDDPEEMTLSLKEFNKLKKHMFINTAWYYNAVWVFTPECIINILSINGESLIDREISELQEILPGITIKNLEVNFRTKDKWDKK